jgi:hypothetical protein
MHIETVANTGLTYHLIAYDAAGRERADDPDGLMSRRAVAAVGGSPITDVFLFSHGWMGDIPAAREQYGRWAAAMAVCAADVERMKDVRPGFLPLLVGLHWPSLPWGDDSFGQGDRSFSVAGGGEGGGGMSPTGTDEFKVGDGTPPTPEEVAAERTSGTPPAREALRTIFAAAEREIAPASLPQDVRDAYEVLARETVPAAAGPDAAPGVDREPFDPERVYRAAAGARGPFASFGAGFGEGLLAPLRTLSFWAMKDRARRFGEGPAHDLLAALQAAAGGAGRDVRFHLMGHSFGCIVVSAMAAGPSADAPAVPVASMTLAQGALSLWSFCEEHPFGARRPGYFRRVLDGRVRGPVVTTRSEHDLAVGRWYPWAAGAARQVDLAAGDLPKYGAVGSFGAQGPGLDPVDLDLLGTGADYGFEPGKLYNLQAGRVIRLGGGFSGAHSDIAHPEVAHAVWQAAGARG